VADYFFDSSALVKAYIAETGTTWVRTILDDEQHRIYISQMAALEVVAALTRRFHVGDLTLQERDQAAHDVRNDCMDYLAIGVTHEFIETAIDFALRHNLRAYDAAQLASAVTVRNVLSQTPEYAGLTLASADFELNRAAALEGLQVEDPNTH
jgi:predicted nucleic acid-binding protein